MKFSLALLAITGCNHPTAESVPPTVAPPTAIDDTCLYSDERPTDPTPASPCRTESFGLHGTRLRHVEVQTDSADGLTGTVSRTYVGSVLVLRESVVEGPNGIIFEAFEHLEFDPDGLLPQTYGQPATQSVTTERDAFGNAINERIDVAMDGTIDTEYTRSFDGEQLIEETRWDAGVRASYHTFRPDGRPLHTNLIGREQVTWTYDDGLLILEEHTPANGEPVTHTWSERSPGVPTSLEVHRGQALIATHTWMYDSDDRLRREDSMRRVGSGEETILIEYDARGHKTHEQAWSWDPTCSDFNRLWTLVGDVVVLHTTTCDDQARGSSTTELNTQGQPIHTMRSWGETTNEERMEYDACGALTLREASQSGEVVRTQTWQRDGQGRLVQATDHRAPASGTTTTWSWDADGSLLERTGASFQTNADGQLVEIEYTSGIRENRGGWGAAPLDESTYAMRFSYTCDEPQISN